MQTAKDPNAGRRDAETAGAKDTTDARARQQRDYAMPWMRTDGDVKQPRRPLR
jgi:hypothetical protein